MKAIIMQPASQILAKSFTSQRVSNYLLFGIILSCAVVTLFFISQRIWLDDAFISFRYAKNLYEGHGLVFNPGEPVEGYTNFLWTLVIYLGLSLGFSAIHFAQLVSILSQILILWLTYRLGRSESRNPYVSLIAPALLACHVSFLAYPMTGMETIFFTLLITLAVVMLKEQYHETVAGGMVLGCVLLASALVRFDGLVMISILLGSRLLVDRKFKNLIPAIGVLVTGLALYNLWRFHYYPTLLPNTFYAKVGFTKYQFRKGLEYIGYFGLRSVPLVLVLASLPFVLKRASRTALFVAWVVVAHLLYVAFVGGDWMPFFRFNVPILPLLYFLAQEGMIGVYDLTKNRIRRSRISRTAGIVAVTLVFAVNLTPLYQGRALGAQIGQTKQNSMAYASVIGMNLNTILNSDAVVATEWAGVLPFYMKQPVLDMLGLTDRDITRQDFRRTRIGSLITADYLASRKPDMVVFCLWLYTSVEDAMGRAEAMLKRGTNVYAYLCKQNLYRVCIMQIQQGYWPVLIKIGSSRQQDLCAGDPETSP